MTMATMAYLKRETERIRMESEQEQNSSSSNKRLKPTTTTNLQDILSHLPEPLINHILNFLDMKQIVQTCLLSKRWQNLWESIPNLYFNDLKWYLTQTGPGRKFKKNKFRYFVDSVLLLRDGSDIQKFTLYFSSSCVSDNKRLDRWISYALRRNVQVLTFGATEFFHTNVIRLSGYVRTLEFKGVFFPCDDGSDDGVLNMDLVNVEHLLFEDCGYCNVKKLVVNAPALKSLMIDTYDKRLNHSTVVKICCPKMVVILCKGYMFKDYTLENCGNVVIAKIDTIVNPIEKGLPDIPKMDGEGFGRCLNKLIHGLGNVRCLTLSAHGLQGEPGRTLPTHGPATALQRFNSQ
ncbi:hypothetical protein IFM89_019554 [Coptis chinensis]|uniref:F-box domain-containing protein n=1 Tax=Coptis chinensis TaxID=261450 RepID=A0A835I1K5_9MAGN|nr:hypothetical protein IFM89_019554 [Coptis chinensis]